MKRWKRVQRLLHVHLRMWMVAVLAVVLATGTGLWRWSVVGDTATTTNLDPQFGVEPGWTLTNLTASQLSSRLAGVKKLGVTWVRFDVDWALVQPNNATTYDWSAYDRVIGAINAAGLHGLGIIDYSPTWAQGTTRGGVQVPPANDAAYATFAAAVATRYAPQGMHDWEIWNEPNWQSFWAPAPNAYAYTALLKATYPAIHKADPSATVIAAGLSGTGSDGKDVDATAFLEEMYAGGAKGSFDAIAMHPYTFPRLATDDDANSWQDMYILHAIMVANNDGGKKIWITEYGAPTQGSGATATQAGPARGGVDHVSEATQAALATAAVKAYDSLPFAGPFFWYDYQDVPGSTAEATYGLVRADGTPKPAYAAYQSAIAASSK